MRASNTNNIISHLNNTISKLEVKIFLVLFAVRILGNLIATLDIVSGVNQSFNQPSIFLLTRRIFHAFVFFVSLHYIKRKIFHNSAVYVLMFGMLGQSFMSLFATITGFTLSSSASTYSHLYLSILRYIAFFLTIRFVIIKNLSMSIVKINLLILGTFLLALYIINFDGLQFLNPNTLMSMFLAQGRYRYAFGLNHVNTLGFHCFYYLSFLAIYKHMKTLPRLNTKRGWKIIDFYLSWICSPVAIIMLLSSASRAAITAIILFWMLFYFINNYQKMGARTRFMYIFLSIMIIIMLIVFIDWNFLYRESSREVNYINAGRALENINTLIFGFGIVGAGDEFTRFTGGAYVDSAYLANLLQSGILGCLFLFGGIFYFTFCYFRNINKLSTLHKLCGCFLVAVLYRGLFEGALFELVAWMLFVMCMNERTSRKKILMRCPVLQ